MSSKSARSHCDRQRFLKWNDITEFFVRRCSLGLRKSVTRITVRGRRHSKRRFLGIPRTGRGDPFAAENPLTHVIV